MLTDTASVNVVPTRGAIVRARFDTRVGYRVLMNLTQANGKAVPFGATATLLDTTKESSSIVGEDGQLYISGMPEKGALQVNWGKDQHSNAAWRLRCRNNRIIPAW